MSLVSAAENTGVTRSVNVRSAEGDLARSVELPAEVFDVPLNVPLIHQVVVAQQAAARQGTHATKTRGDVSGGGKKPYRQKGTGRARQGSIRAPQFTGGGVVHGPQPRSYDQRTPKKMKSAALRGALSDRARHGRIHVVSALVEGDAPSTKSARLHLEAILPGRRPLVVAERTDVVTWLSLRNLTEVHLLTPGQLNTYDVLVADDVVFTEGAFAAFLAGPPKGRGAEVEARESELARLADAVDTLAARPVAAPPEPAPKPARARRTTKKEEAAVTEQPATEAGTTEPAGGGESDAELAKEVAEQTSSDLKAEDTFERESEGAAGDTEAAKADADELEGDK